MGQSQSKRAASLSYHSGLSLISIDHRDAAGRHVCRLPRVDRWQHKQLVIHVHMFVALLLLLCSFEHDLVFRQLGFTQPQSPLGRMIAALLLSHRGSMLLLRQVKLLEPS